MGTSKLKSFLFLVVSLSCSAVFAGNLHGVVTMGGDFGGDTIWTLKYDDGTTSSLKTGQGLLFSGGIIYDFNDRFSLQSTIGIKYQQTADATNQSTSFTRYPLEALGFYNINPASVRVGGGLAYDISPTVNATGALINGTINFGSTLGYVVEADWVPQQRFIVGARYTIVQYKTSGTTLNGDSIGFQLGYIF